VTQGGDLDINFEVNDPNGKPLVAEVRRRDGLHGIDIKVTGDFEICMDNTFSRMTGKKKSMSGAGMLILSSSTLNPSLLAELFSRK